MPLPKPKPSEDKTAFIERCLSSASIQKEFSTNEQRLAVCNALWLNAEKREDIPSGQFVKIQKTDPIHKIVKGVVYSALDVDTDGETMTVDDVQKTCWNFLAQRREKNIDLQHDWQKSGCYVVESYMTEKNDPNFPDNSWVLSVKCSDEVFQKVVNGELNGFSFGGYSEKFAQKVLVEVAKQIIGTTNPNLNKDIIPPHQHQFIIWYDNDGKIVKGTTDTVEGHLHTISYGTATDFSISHNHGVSIVED